MHGRCRLFKNIHSLDCVGAVIRLFFLPAGFSAHHLFPSGAYAGSDAVTAKTGRTPQGPAFLRCALPPERDDHMNSCSLVMPA
jgi:hypothetical protein